MVEEDGRGVRGNPEWERKEQLAAAMVEFLEGWVIRELCLHFRIIAEGVYSETAEHRLIGTLLEAYEPLTLGDIATRCRVSRDLLEPNGRIRRAIDRMENQGMVENLGRDGRPRYALNRRNVRVQLISKIFEKPRGRDGLVAVTLRDGIGPQFD
jgi:hypothetical protein